MEAIKTKRKLFYWPSKFELIVSVLLATVVIAADKLLKLDLNGHLYQWFGI